MLIPVDDTLAVRFTPRGVWMLIAMFIEDPAGFENAPAGSTAEAIPRIVDRAERLVGLPGVPIPFAVVQRAIGEILPWAHDPTLTEADLRGRP